METQAQMFDMRELYMKHLYSMEEAELKERGANTRAAKSDKTTMEKERIAVLREKSDIAQRQLTEANKTIVDLNYYIDRLESKGDRTPEQNKLLEVYKKQKGERLKEYQAAWKEYQDTVNEMSRSVGLPISSSPAPTIDTPTTDGGGWSIKPK
jgi:chromosome segregation ATPase